MWRCKKLNRCELFEKMAWEKKLSKVVFTSSKLTIKPSEQGAKYVQS